MTREDYLVTGARAMACKELASTLTPIPYKDCLGTGPISRTCHRSIPYLWLQHWVLLPRAQQTLPELQHKGQPSLVQQVEP
jgi:hypothetical protein